MSECQSGERETAQFVCSTILNPKSRLRFAAEPSIDRRFPSKQEGTNCIEKLALGSMLSSYHFPVRQSAKLSRLTQLTKMCIGGNSMCRRSFFLYLFALPLSVQKGCVDVNRALIFGLVTCYDGMEKAMLIAAAGPSPPAKQQTSNSRLHRFWAARFLHHQPSYNPTHCNMGVLRPPPLWRLQS